VKLGVLTVGGDAPGLNAVIRAVVRAAVHEYGSDVFGVSQGFEGLLRPPQLWPLSIGAVRGLVRRGGTILGCNHGDPFDVDGEDRSDEILETIRWFGLDGLICIGGQGSLAIAQRLTLKGVPVVCIPKSVENDLAGTKLTFGYATAVALATQAIDNLQTTGESSHRVVYLEVLGREAGWIALSAGVAGGADVILVPEIPFDPARIEEVIRGRQASKRTSTIIVVSEGARPVGGTPVAPNHAAARVADLVGELLGDHDRMVTVLGHLQRGGDPIPQDRVLASRFGAAAVRAIHEREFGKLVAIRGSSPTLIPLDGLIGRVRRIDPAGERAWMAHSMGISFGAEPRG
jgi:6-phosphofructokinase